jgi:hypothetical protein
MEFDRRTFLQRSLMAVAATMVVTRSRLPAEQGGSQSAGELLSSMKWTNDPAAFQQSGGWLRVRSKPKTDFWRKTFYGYTTDNSGPFFICQCREILFFRRE